LLPRFSTVEPVEISELICVGVGVGVTVGLGLGDGVGVGVAVGVGVGVGVGLGDCAKAGDAAATTESTTTKAAARAKPRLLLFPVCDGRNEQRMDAKFRKGSGLRNAEK
jgi:hypothetical protein